MMEASDGGAFGDNKYRKMTIQFIDTLQLLTHRGRLDERFRVEIRGPGLDHAESLFMEALANQKKVGDRLNESISLHYLSMIAQVRGDDDAASELSQQSKAIRDELYPVDDEK